MDFSLSECQSVHLLTCSESSRQYRILLLDQSVASPKTLKKTNFETLSDQGRSQFIR